MAIIKKLTCRWKFACANCLRNNDIYYGGLIRFIFVVDRNIFIHRKRTKIFYANITQCNENFSVSSSTSPCSNLTYIVHQETVTEEALLTAPPFTLTYDNNIITGIQSRYICTHYCYSVCTLLVRWHV